MEGNGNQRRGDLLQTSRPPFAILKWDQLKKSSTDFCCLPYPSHGLTQWGKSLLQMLQVETHFRVDYENPKYIGWYHPWTNHHSTTIHVSMISNHVPIFSCLNHVEPPFFLKKIKKHPQFINQQCFFSQLGPRAATSLRLHMEFSVFALTRSDSTSPPRSFSASDHRGGRLLGRPRNYISIRCNWHIL